MTKKECPICGRDDCSVVYSEKSDSGNKPELFYSGYCKTCGEVCVSVDLVDIKVLVGLIDRSEFFGYLKRHSINMEKSGKLQPKTIRTRNDLEEGVIRPSTPLDQVDMLIEYIASKQKTLSECVEVDGSKDYPVCFAKNESDFYFIIEYAYELDYIKGHRMKDNPIQHTANKLVLTDRCLMLTLKGWKRFHELQNQSPYSKQVFVAFDFKNEGRMKKIYDNAISPAISECGLIPYTTLDDEHGDSINDVILDNIRKSKFIVADVTYASQNVYYEAGFAYGLGLNVVFTCDNERAEEDMRFDTSHFKHILWKDEEDLKKKLIIRIGALRFPSKP